MDRLEEVREIIDRDITSQDKVKLLQDLLIDLKNEMEAQDQNMHPEVRTRLPEAYQIASQYVLKNRNN